MSSTSETSSATEEVVVAREAVVVNVGGRPRKYGRVVVKDNRTQQEVEIDDTDNPPLDEGDPGMGYAFREGQRVRASHPAVRACPSAFRPLDATDALLSPQEVNR
jgi:hypothetical protein